MSTKKQMKKFKELWKNIPPTKILVPPCHGKHAQEKKNLKEDTKKQDIYSWTDGQKNKHDEQEKHLSKHYHQHNNVNGNLALAAYTTASHKLNGNLVNHAAGHTDEIDDKHTNNIKDLDKFLKGSPALARDTEVYHGLRGWHPGMEAHKHPEGLIHLPAYTSTSIRRETAHEFSGHSNIPTTRDARHILHIKMKKGQKPGAYVEHSSTTPEDKEFLIHRNAKFKIERKPKILSSKKGIMPNNHVYVWTAHYQDESKNKD